MIRKMASPLRDIRVRTRKDWSMDCEASRSTNPNVSPAARHVAMIHNVHVNMHPGKGFLVFADSDDRMRSFQQPAQWYDRTTKMKAPAVGLRVLIRRTHMSAEQAQEILNHHRTKHESRAN